MPHKSESPPLHGKPNVDIHLPGPARDPILAGPGKSGGAHESRTERPNTQYCSFVLSSRSAFCIKAPDSAKAMTDVTDPARFTSELHRAVTHADATVELGAPELEPPPLTEFREWDRPPYPERHVAPVSRCSIYTSKSRAAPAARSAPLRDRFLAGYVRVMVGATKIIVGAARGLIVALVIWFVVTILTLPRP
jgi:hypothetical protein